MRILGIESSCDETAAAVVEDGSRILSSVVASQICDARALWWRGSGTCLARTPAGYRSGGALGAGTIRSTRLEDLEPSPSRKALDWWGRCWSGSRTLRRWPGAAAAADRGEPHRGPHPCGGEPESVRIAGAGSGGQRRPYAPYEVGENFVYRLCSARLATTPLVKLSTKSPNCSASAIPVGP